MAFDFPSSPSVGQTYQGYTWDGEKWTVAATGGAMRRYYYVATAGQVTFTGTDAAGQTLAYSPGGVEVSVNGVWLPYVDYTASNGTSVVLGAAAAAGDIIYIYALSNFSVLDPLTAKKNYILNGAMMVSQENGTTAGTATGYFPVDQFNANISSSGTFSAAQVASLSPAGSPNRIRYTVTAADAAVGASDIAYFETRIEGLRVADLQFGLATAKTITIRFGCKGPAGTYCVALTNGSRSYIAEYVISAGEANTDVVKTVTIVGDQSGTWPKDNGLGLLIRWGLMAGSSFQQAAGSWAAGNMVGSANQFNLLGTNGNVFELFDVGMYEGSAAPAYQVPDFARELALCQRYWEASGLGPGHLTTGFFYNTTFLLSEYRFKVPKRTTPTFATKGAASDFTVYRAGANNAIDTLPTLDIATTEAAQVRFTHSTAPFTAGQSGQGYTGTGNGRLTFNARM